MYLTSTGIALRFLFALLLVLLSYNPSGHSYFHWLYSDMDVITPYIVIAGLLLAIGWGTYIKATLNSMGMLGVVACAVLLGCVVWLFIYWGWLSTNNVSALSWIIEVLLAVLLTIGMCWSHLTRRMSGQVDVDVDEIDN
jgi:hypothetical protein